MEALRRLRNECRKFMTGHTKVITKAQQEKWWNAEWRRAFLMVDGGTPVAFAYIARKGGVNWITLGVTEKRRGESTTTIAMNTTGMTASARRIEVSAGGLR